MDRRNVEPGSGLPKSVPAASIATLPHSLNDSAECQDILMSKASSLKLVPEKLFEPLRWNKAKMVFVNSMSEDLLPSRR